MNQFLSVLCLTPVTYFILAYIEYINRTCLRHKDVAKNIERLVLRLEESKEIVSSDVDYTLSMDGVLTLDVRAMSNPQVESVKLSFTLTMIDGVTEVENG